MRVNYLKKYEFIIIILILLLVFLLIYFGYKFRDKEEISEYIDDCVVTSLNLNDRDNNYVFTKDEQEIVCKEWEKLSKEHYGNDEKFEPEYVIYINDEQFSMVCEQIVVKYNGKYVLLNNNINEVIKRVCYAGIIE